MYLFSFLRSVPPTQRTSTALWPWNMGRGGLVYRVLVKAVGSDFLFPQHALSDPPTGSSALRLWRFGSAQDRQAFGGDQHLDAARCPRLAVDQPSALQREHHLVHTGRRHIEVALHIDLGGRAFTRV